MSVRGSGAAPWLSIWASCIRAGYLLGGGDVFESIFLFFIVRAVVCLQGANAAADM